MKEQLEKQFVEQTGGNVYSSGITPSLRHSVRYVQWLEKRVLLMTKLTAKAHEDLIVSHDLTELMRESNGQS